MENNRISQPRLEAPDDTKRTWYYHDKCEVYGHMLMKACWLCGDDDVVNKAPIILDGSSNG